jgi:hypothetical protein
MEGFPMWEPGLYVHSNHCARAKLSSTRTWANWGTHGVTGEVEMGRNPHGKVSMMASAYTRVYPIPFVDPVYPH